MLRYYTFTIIFIISFTNFLIFYTYPFLLDKLGVAEGTAGIVVALATTLTLLFRIMAGFIIDRRPPKRALTQAHVIYLLSFLMLYSDSFWIVATGRIILGCALGFIATLLLYYSVSSEPQNKEKAKSISLLTFFSILPTCIAPFTALQLKQHMGIDAITAIAIGAVLVSLVLAFITDQKINVDYPKHNNHLLEEFSAILFDRPIKTVIFVLVLTYIISGTTVTFLPRLFEQRGVENISVYFFIFSTFMVLPRFLLKNKMPDGSHFPYLILATCVLMGLIGNSLNAFSENLVLLSLAAALNGATLGILYPAIMAYTICSVSGRLNGSVSAVIAGAADTGVILSNFVLGALSNQLDLATSLLFPIATSVLAGVILLFYLSAEKRVNKAVC